MVRKRDAAQPAEGAPAPAEQKQQKAPAHEIRIGRIRCLVWENVHAAHGTWYSVTFSRSFQDSDGTARNASSFGREDLLVLSELARQAFLWVAQKGDGGGGLPESGAAGPAVPPANPA